MEPDHGKWIHLNVGGTRMVTTRDTLLRRNPGNVLATMFCAGRDGPGQLAPADRDERGDFLLDRPPVVFGHLLDWLRTGVIPHACDRVALREEAQYWQLEKLVAYLAETPDFPDRGAVVRALLHQPLREDGFVGVKLCGLDLSNLVLEGVNFQRACWTGCNLAGVEATKVTFSLGVFERASLERATLTASVFASCKMTGASFRGAQLTHAIFQKASLRGADFSEANLQDAHFQDADLRDCNFRGANLESAHFADADCRGAVFEWAELGPAPFMRGVKVTQEQYNGIGRADKISLKLRVEGNEDSASMVALKQLIGRHDVVVFVLGYGSVTGDGLGEQYSNDAVRMLAALPADRFTTNVIDVVGSSVMIDDLYALAQTRSWPKIFVRGAFLGVHAKLAEFIKRL